MIIIQVLDEPCQCAVGVVDVRLELVNSRSCYLRMSSVSTIWYHWYTWSTCCWIHLGTSAAAELVVTGSNFGGQEGHSIYCLVTVHYVSGCIYIPSIS